ncbi:hypothetical protein RJ40_02390 [Methanofollis aquaemaris]|uniref:Uncharacterized protein n=1 Tax=Methanofollis aquaemaris TaxID=126734 RepID=A0A8A3S457_9EURY|nr:hypothetical protein [Methanofollis aquaemaris]QSZ66426.1 hypothetical protein RJ40_02390 [Methanofollis aquaemaris]
MQATLTAFSPVNPAWLDLVLSRDGKDFEFTPAIRDLRGSSGCRPMTAHLCMHSFTDGGLCNVRGDPLFTGYCRLRHRGDTTLPTYCNPQFWPWYLCPHYAPREASP